MVLADVPLSVAQIDLRIEANNLDTFVENFNDVSFIRFPLPLRPFVSRDVLVETYEVAFIHVSYHKRKHL